MPTPLSAMATCTLAASPCITRRVRTRTSRSANGLPDMTVACTALLMRFMNTWFNLPGWHITTVSSGDNSNTTDASSRNDDRKMTEVDSNNSLMLALLASSPSMRLKMRKPLTIAVVR